MSKALELGLTYSVSKEIGSKFVEEAIIEDGDDGCTLHASICVDGVSCAHIVKELLKTTTDEVYLTLKFADGSTSKRFPVNLM